MPSVRFCSMSTLGMKRGAKHSPSDPLQPAPCQKALKEEKSAYLCEDSCRCSHRHVESITLVAAPDRSRQLLLFPGKLPPQRVSMRLAAADFPDFGRRTGMFCKPKAGSTTRHLFVGNCGPAVGLTTSQVQDYFECTGAEAVTIPSPAQGASSHVFVTYKTITEAEEVLEALTKKPPAELGSRKLVVKHADKRATQLADKVLLASD